MNTVFTPFANAELVFEVSTGTFTEDPSTLNMIPDSRKETVLCMLRQPKTQVEEIIQPGNDQQSFVLKGHAVEPKYFPAGLAVGNVADIILFDAATGQKQKGFFKILSLQQSAYAIVSQVKGHAITGSFVLTGTGGIGIG